MRISDWSSDVCSSDLPDRDRPALPGDLAGHLQQVRPPAHGDRTGLLMSTFPVLSTMANGISVFRTWMDAIGDNLANLNTVRSTDEAAFQARSEERRGGKECVSTCRSGCPPYHKKKKKRVRIK